jgi:prephenate dehydrogenase
MPADREQEMSQGGFPRSVIVQGTGLIGSSLALAVRKRLPGIRVYGIDSPEVLDRARRLGAVDSELAPANADLTILATPVGAILKSLDEISSSSGLLMDVGSTKVDICRKAEALKLPFLGGHPMTGSERAGPEAASPDLFTGDLFFLCPVSTTPPDAIPKIKSLLEAIDAKPVVIDPEQHDKLVARLSHLPQIVSTLLADQTSANRNLAGPGWKSVTRLAASPFHVWRDILQTSGSLPDELRAFIARLRDVLDALEAGNMQEVEALFDRANRGVSGEANE